VLHSAFGYTILNSLQPTPELIVSEFGKIRVDLKSKVCTMFDCHFGDY